MTTADSVPARQLLRDTLRPLLPPKARWQLIDHEAPAEDSGRTRVRIAQRTIVHSATGDPSMHTIGFALVITVPTDDGLEAAEAKLDDDMDAFLHALDTAGVPWTTATKGRYADEGNRLGYTVDGVEAITHNTEGQPD